MLLLLFDVLRLLLLGLATFAFLLLLFSSGFLGSFGILFCLGLLSILFLFLFEALTFLLGLLFLGLLLG